MFLAHLSFELSPPSAAEECLLDDDGDEADTEEKEDDGDTFLQDHETSSPLRLTGQGTLWPKTSVRCALNLFTANILAVVHGG
jgi:hypothetical protein